VAAKHAGCNDLLCVTYGEPGQQLEVELAQAVCRRLGLRHDAHIVDVEAPKLRHSLVAYAANVPEPCADPATIASISAVGSYCDRDTVVLDGSGSDYYFWSPPRRLDGLKIRLSPGRFQTVRNLRRLLPFYTRHERLLASPIEPYLLHGAWLRHCDSRRFYPESVDTHRFWLRELEAHGRIPNQEARFQARAMYVGPGAHMMKIRNAAVAANGTALFPWANQEVAEFCFNLPQGQRFDRKSGKSKVLVRQMLREAIAYDDDLIGKHPFLFGKRRFLEAHMDFCRDEILNCKLWSREIESTVSRLVKKLRQGQHTENALLALLMVSLWHEHWFMDRFQRSRKPQPLQQAV
jgi:asparagine synthetase B (glutamine-hydrolysing)